MWAEIDAVQIDIAVGHRPVHPFCQTHKLVFAKFATGNARLVGDQHQCEAHAFQFTTGVNHAINKLEIIYFMDVAMIDINRAVTI
ncbi:hypothetical protein D3C77_748360 [compost metagenome]